MNGLGPAVLYIKKPILCAQKKPVHRVWVSPDVVTIPYRKSALRGYSDKTGRRVFKDPVPVPLRLPD